MPSLIRELLNESDDEYRDVAKLFRKGCRTKDSYLKIEAIEMIENLVLFRKFCKKKEEYQRKYGQVRVERVFHGTKRTNITSILLNNLEVQRHGQNIGHRFGAGVSFSAFSSYASHYCDKFTSGDQMLLCYVLVSNIIEVQERRDKHSVLAQPPHLEGRFPLRYDTTAKNKEKMDVIVKFEDHTFYPAFIIHFTRLPKFPASHFRSSAYGSNRVCSSTIYDDTDLYGGTDCCDDTDQVYVSSDSNMYTHPGSTSEISWQDNSYSPAVHTKPEPLTRQPNSSSQPMHGNASHFSLRNSANVFSASRDVPYDRLLSAEQGTPEVTPEPETFSFVTSLMNFLCCLGSEESD